MIDAFGVEKRAPYALGESKKVKRAYWTHARDEANRDVAVAATGAGVAPVMVQQYNKRIVPRVGGLTAVPVPPARGMGITRSWPLHLGRGLASLKGAGRIARTAKHPGTTAALSLAVGTPLIIANEKSNRSSKLALKRARKKDQS